MGRKPDLEVARSERVTVRLSEALRAEAERRTVELGRASLSEHLRLLAAADARSHPANR